MDERLQELINHGYIEENAVEILQVLDGHCDAPEKVTRIVIEEL